LQSGATQDEIIKCLTEEYEVTEKNAISDVDHFMAMLKALNLIED
jgi:hypothetical protein